jgi:hypothetical protein
MDIQPFITEIKNSLDTTFSLGKIDVNEYLYFLAQHGMRHIAQMEKNELDFSGVKK